MGSLPKTRPQRPSARRSAARSKAAENGDAADSPRAKKATTAAKPKRKRAPKAKAEPTRAPRQGFEAESDVEPGKPVAPPGGAELAASAVELLGEMAQSGLTSGGRLLKDALSRLSRS